MKYPPSECFLNAYSLITSMLFLSSSHSSTSLSSTFSTSPLHLCCVVPTLLSNYAVHLLYTGILANPIILRVIEDLPLYDEDMICQELICLFHLVLSTQQYHALAASSDLPTPVGIPLRTSLNTIPGCVLNLLHIHGFHTFVERIPSNVLYSMFQRVFLYDHGALPRTDRTSCASIPAAYFYSPSFRNTFLPVHSLVTTLLSTSLDWHLIPHCC